MSATALSATALRVTGVGVPGAGATPAGVTAIAPTLLPHPVPSMLTIPIKVPEVALRDESEAP